MDLHNTKELFPIQGQEGLCGRNPVLVHTALQQNTARTQQSSNSLEEARRTLAYTRLYHQAQKSGLEVSLGYRSSSCLKTNKKLTTRRYSSVAKCLPRTRDPVLSLGTENTILQKNQQLHTTPHHQPTGKHRPHVLIP